MNVLFILEMTNKYLPDQNTGNKAEYPNKKYE